MKYYTSTTQFNCGIDLHARQMYVCVLAQRLEARLNNKFKANTVLAIKLARSVYFMLRRHTVFDPDRLVAALARH